MTASQWISSSPLDKKFAYWRRNPQFLCEPDWKCLYSLTWKIHSSNTATGTIRRSHTETRAQPRVTTTCRRQWWGCASLRWIYLFAVWELLCNSRKRKQQQPEIVIQSTSRTEFAPSNLCWGIPCSTAISKPNMWGFKTKSWLITGVGWLIQKSFPLVSHYLTASFFCFRNLFI